MTDKYPDCQSCAFSDGSADSICDSCDDGDQWEEIDDYYDIGSSNVMIKSVAEKVITFIKPEELRIAA